MFKLMEQQIEHFSIEITHLEQVFNNGNLFLSVKRVLMLAGDYCYVMDTGSWDNIEK